MNYFDDDYSYEDKDTFLDSRRPRIGKYVKKIFKFIARALIIIVYLLIFIRINTAKVPKKFKDFLWTDQALAVKDEQDFAVLTQKSENSIDEDGLYHIDNIYLCRTAKQVQLTLRYNSRNTINVLMDEYGLTERPTGESFVYILRDGDGNAFAEYRFAADEKPLNEFRKLVFGNVEFPEDDESILYLEIYYGNDVRKGAPMNVTLTVFDNARYFEPVETTPSEPTFELKKAPSYINRLESDE